MSIDTSDIGIIGGGNMGKALVGGLIQHGVLPDKIWVSDHHLENQLAFKENWKVQTTSNNLILAKQVEILVLAVKPQGMRQLIEEIASTISSHTLVISIAAGITTQQIARWMGGLSIPLIRAMPNTPALLGAGITCLFAVPSVKTLHREKAQNLMQAVGETLWVDDENLMDVVTAVSGSGPAYFFYMMECLIQGAEKLGLPSDIARKLTTSTALGSAKMAAQSLEEIKTLRERVTSPKGTTEEGIKILKNGKLDSLLEKTLEAATQRSKSLSKQYD